MKFWFDADLFLHRLKGNQGKYDFRIEKYEFFKFNIYYS